MRRRLAAGALLCCLALYAPRVAGAESEVFDGDPTDPESGEPYEILPGQPLVKAGPDGILGTSDDVVDTSIVGDIDLVVRSGSPVAAPAIPPPAALGGRAALPVGVAGSSEGGGLEIPFTAYLCGSGCYGENASAPYGFALQTLDMDDFPVIVAAFADLDDDGFIGPTTAAALSSPAAVSLQVRELEPVGRAVAHFDDGVARGKLAIQVGLPASQGGLRIALVAAASSGPFNQGKYNGVIGSGSGIATALPFLPQKDFTRFLRATAEPAGPDTTIYPLIQFAAIPALDGWSSYALPLDGSSPTIDAAVVNSQPAVRVAFREDPGTPKERSAAGDLILGTSGSARRRRLRLVPVDRLDNPADPAAGLAVTVRAGSPLRIVHPGKGSTEQALSLPTADGRRVVLQVPPGSADGTTGLVTVEQDGIVVAAHPYRIDPRVNRLKADVVAPSATLPTIQSALEAATDRNGDGLVVVSVRPGVFYERLVIDHPLVLQGAGAERTIVRGDGTGPVVSVVAPNVEIRRITAVGGTTGFALAGPSAALVEARAWHNDGAGVTVSGASASLWRSGMIDNSGDGLLAQDADQLACEESTAFLNGGAGLRIIGGAGGRIEASSIASNSGSGVVVMGTDLQVNGNRSIVNLGSGMETSSSSGAQVMANLSATNDGDGLHMDSPNGDLVWGNVLVNNGQYGVWLGGSMNADFSPNPGQQRPIGNNKTAANGEGSVSLPGD